MPRMLACISGALQAIGEAMGNFPPLTIYHYFINLDERGLFFGDVRNTRDRTVFEIHGYDIFEDGFMRHAKDLDGLKAYLIHLSLMRPCWQLEAGNFIRTHR
jgi:hypothetical protein